MRQEGQVSSREPLEAPPPVRLIPGSADVVRAFVAPPSGTEEQHPVLIAAGLLAGGHREQWDAEDACRDAGADDHALAASKRAIDLMNAARADLMEQVDAWAAANLHGDAEAALHTETLGHLVDRLAVAWVRSRQLAQRAGDAPQERPIARAALRQLAELCDAYDDLVRDLRDGRRRLPQWRSLKRYGAQP